MGHGIELLAPAGNMECLKAAVQNGADAVYFAGQEFGARSYADNFDADAILRAADYCHLRSAAAYVTVNTGVLDREFGKLESFIRTLARAGIDGVIVQDLGVIRTIRQICPALPLHGSTQMTVHNLDGVRAAEALGLCRVVLSRELSFDDIKYIIDNCQAEIEVFVHGAMCMSYSGQCLMSSVLGGRSGNRGRCAQPCRLSYTGAAGEGHYLSLKDMSLIEHSRQLARSGIASLKIEGRMKGPEYVAAVVRTYRNCLDAERQPAAEEAERLNRVFYRGGLTDGYFTGHTGRTMFAFDKPDNPYARLTDEPAEPKEEKKIPLTAKVSVEEGKPMHIQAQYRDTVVDLLGEVPAEPAKQRGISEEEIYRQLTKTGGVPFVFEKIDAELRDGLFLPVRELNEVRRRILAGMEQKILEGYPRWETGDYTEVSIPSQQKFLGYTCAVRTEEQFWAAAAFDFRYLYLPMDVLEKEPERFLQEADRIVILPPAIQRERESKETEKVLERLHNMGFRHLMAENMGMFRKAKQFCLHGGHRLNLFNTRALTEVKEAGLVTACLSPELNLAQIRDLGKILPAEMIVYGHLPLMVTENCILKNTGDCSREGGQEKPNCPAQKGTGRLYDRKGMAFPVVRDGTACRSVVLNTLPTYMGDKKEELRKSGTAYQRLWFTIEDAETCRRICRDYLLDVPCQIEQYTRLHFYKGVQ